MVPTLQAQNDSPARILLIEDDPNLRVFACVTLATPDVLLETVTDSSEALSRLEQCPFDLVLVGAATGDMDGCTFVERLRALPSLEFVPVLMVTEGDDPGKIDAAFRAGATSFVVKPLKAHLFLHQLRYILRASRKEQEVRQAHARVAQALAIKATVLRLVQHELRTPLTSIIGFAEYIASHPTARNVPEFATFIVDAGRRFSHQIDDLVAAAHILTAETRLNVDDCRVGQVLAAVVQAEADPGAGVRVLDDTGNACIACDRALLVRAIRGLLRNALQHGQGPVDIMATRERDSIVFAVRDHGAGIPQTTLETSFEPFQQAQEALSRDGEGLGLGLPVARRIIEAHGGTLRLSALDGAGCVALATVPTGSRESEAA